MNNWEKFCEYINSLPNGTIFYRKDIIKYIYQGRKINKYTTIDIFKRCSELNGVLDAIGRGTYMKNHDIPNMHFINFQYHAYNDPLCKGSSIMDLMNQI